MSKIGIDHIEFWVSNLKRSLKFYEGLFKIIKWNKITKNGFSDGETQIYFIQQKVKKQKTTGPRHICFYADSKNMVDKVCAFLKKYKVPIIRGPINSVWKSHRSYTIDFKDPDGYVLEVTKSLN